MSLPINLLLFAITLIFVSCDRNKIHRTIIDEHTIVEGNIDNDTIYDGLIKFFDRKTGKILSEENYLQGIPDGPRIEYWDNGKVKSASHFKNGLQNGEVTFFDSQGRLLGIETYYYGLAAGSKITYLDGQIGKYQFYSLENTLLFEIVYDSVRGRTLEKTQNNFFYFSSRPFASVDELAQGRSPMWRDYFMYTMNPPGYEFNYDIVRIDSSLKVVSQILEIKSGKIFQTFSLKQSERNVAIRLSIEDSSNENILVMIKKIQ